MLRSTPPRDSQVRTHQYDDGWWCRRIFSAPLPPQRASDDRSCYTLKNLARRAYYELAIYWAN